MFLLFGICPPPTAHARPWPINSKVRTAGEQGERNYQSEVRPLHRDLLGSESVTPQHDAP